MIPQLLIIALAVGALPLTGPASQPASAPARLRVVTWNVHGCSGGIENVVEELRRLEPDVICLQEAETPPASAKGIDQTQFIAKKLRMRHFAAGSQLPNGDEQRMAILSRRPLSSCETMDAGTGRIYGVAAIVGENPEFHVVSIHLTSSYRLDPRHALRTTAARLREAGDLVRRIREWSRPCVVAGDFNALPGLPEHEQLARHLTRATTTQPTCPSDTPMLSIDHIYHSRGFRSHAPQVVNTRVSDHLPVVVDLELSSDSD